jgi:hypothetical protein
MRVKRTPDDRPLTWHDLWFLEAIISLIIVGGIYVLIGQFFSVLTPFLGIGLIFSIVGLPIIVMTLYVVGHERRLGRLKRTLERVSNIENLTTDQKHSQRWEQWIKRQYGKKTKPLSVIKEYTLRNG